MQWGQLGEGDLLRAWRRDPVAEQLGSGRWRPRAVVMALHGAATLEVAASSAGLVRSGSDGLEWSGSVPSLARRRQRIQRPSGATTLVVTIVMFFLKFFLKNVADCQLWDSVNPLSSAIHSTKSLYRLLICREYFRGHSANSSSDSCFFLCSLVGRIVFMFL